MPLSTTCHLPCPFCPPPCSLRDFQAGGLQLQEAHSLASVAVHDCNKLTDGALRQLLALEGPNAAGGLGSWGMLRVGKGWAQHCALTLVAELL